MQIFLATKQIEIGGALQEYSSHDFYQYGINRGLMQVKISSLMNDSNPSSEPELAFLVSIVISVPLLIFFSRSIVRDHEAVVGNFYF